MNSPASLCSITAARGRDVRSTTHAAPVRCGGNCARRSSSVLLTFSSSAARVANVRAQRSLWYYAVEKGLRAEGTALRHVTTRYTRHNAAAPLIQLKRAPLPAAGIRRPAVRAPHSIALRSFRKTNLPGEREDACARPSLKRSAKFSLADA